MIQLDFGAPRFTKLYLNWWKQIVFCHMMTGRKAKVALVLKMVLQFIYAYYVVQLQTLFPEKLFLKCNEYENLLLDPLSVWQKYKYSFHWPTLLYFVNTIKFTVWWCKQKVGTEAGFPLCQIIWKVMILAVAVFKSVISVHSWWTQHLSYSTVCSPHCRIFLFTMWHFQ